MDIQIIKPEDNPSSQSLQISSRRAHNKNPVISYLASLSSKDSRRVQKTALDQIAIALSNHEIQDSLVFPWERLDYGAVTAIKAWLDAKYAPATVNRYLCAVRRVLKEAWRHDLITAEAYQRATDVRSVNAQRLPTGRELETDEIKKLIRVCLSDAGNPTLGLRDAAIISLMYSSGLRRAEVVSLDIEDLNLNKRELHVIGKRNKERHAYLASGAVRAIEKWIEARGSAPGPLFYAVNKSGRIVRHRNQRLSVHEKQNGKAPEKIVARLSDQTIYNVIDKRCFRGRVGEENHPA
jgi:site-specific recombinase XerC